MPLTGIILILLTAVVCIVALALIPALFAVKKAAISVGELAEMVQSELKPTLQELTSVLAELKTVGGGVAEHTDDVRRFMSAIGETGTNLSTINRSLSVVTGALNATTAWTTGAKVAGKYMLDRYLKKKGGM